MYLFFGNIIVLINSRWEQDGTSRALVSPAGSVTSGSDSPPDCYSIPSVSLRWSRLRARSPRGLTVHRTVIQYPRFRFAGLACGLGRLGV